MLDSYEYEKILGEKNCLINILCFISNSFFNKIQGKLFISNYKVYK